MENSATTNFKNLSLRLSSDMATKQAVRVVMVADLAQVGLVAEKAVQVVLVADGVVLVVPVADEVVLVVQAASDLVDRIPTHNHKPSA